MRGCYECDCPNSPCVFASDSLGYVPKVSIGFCGIVDPFLCWGITSDTSFVTLLLWLMGVCPLMMDFVTSWTGIAEPMPVIFVQPALS